MTNKSKLPNSEYSRWPDTTDKQCEFMTEVALMASILVADVLLVHLFTRKKKCAHCNT